MLDSLQENKKVSLGQSAWVKVHKTMCDSKPISAVLLVLLFMHRGFFYAILLANKTAAAVGRRVSSCDQMKCFPGLW
jgi:hypothetical protein